MLQSENSELESQLKWLKRESSEAKAASEANIKDVLSIAEDLRTQKAGQAATIEELKRFVLSDKNKRLLLVCSSPWEESVNVYFLMFRYNAVQMRNWRESSMSKCYELELCRWSTH